MELHLAPEPVRVSARPGRTVHHLKKLFEGYMTRSNSLYIIFITFQSQQLGGKTPLHLNYLDSKSLLSSFRPSHSSRFTLLNLTCWRFFRTAARPIGSMLLNGISSANHLPCLFLRSFKFFNICPWVRFPYPCRPHLRTEICIMPQRLHQRLALQ
jgi:hypothetical protein